MSQSPLPQSGGSYTRDAESGALAPVDQAARKPARRGKTAPKTEEK